MTKGRRGDVGRRIDAALDRAERLGGSSDLADAKRRFMETGEMPGSGAPAAVREYVELIAEFEEAMQGLHVEADPSEYDLSGMDVG